MSQRQTTLHARVSAAILEAAAAVLAERGEQASMADVAAAAGMARATVYRYFPNREALLEALGRLAVEEAGERLRAGRLQEVPVPDAFERAVRALVAIGDSFVVVSRESARPDPEEGGYYVFQLIGLAVEEEGGRSLGRVADVEPGVANDALALDSGLLLPLVEDCVLEIDLTGARVVVARGYADAV